jgi:dolichol-phosphate mannosyltransferase
MNDCIVIIPTYNEIENIEVSLRSVLSQHKPFHILIVDDNSPDHTDKVVYFKRI